MSASEAKGCCPRNSSTPDRWSSSAKRAKYRGESTIGASNTEGKEIGEYGGCEMYEVYDAYKTI